MVHSTNLSWTTYWKFLSISQAFLHSRYPMHIRASKSHSTWFPTEFEYDLNRSWYIFGLIQKCSLGRFSSCQSKSAKRLMLREVQRFLRPWNQNFSQEYVYSIPEKTLWFFSYGFDRTKQAIQNMVPEHSCQTVEIIVALRQFLQRSSSRMQHLKFVINPGPL